MTISPQQLHRVSFIFPPERDRETVIACAGKMVEFFLAEGEQAKARHRLTGCFADRGAMDAAALNAKAALRLMETLIKGRSAETVARMEEARGLSGR